MFCQFELRTRAFYTWHVHNSPYLCFGRKKIEPIMLYEGMMPKFSGPVSPSPSRSCNVRLVHAVLAGAERTVCNIVVSTETTQTTTNSSQTLLLVYKLAHLPLPHSKSSPQEPTTFSLAFLRRCAADVSIRSRPLAQIYLKCISLSTWRYVSVREILSLIACATTQISLHTFKVSPELSCRYM